MNTQVVLSGQVRAKPETPERWVKALERAIANGVEPLQIAGTGEWVVTSASKVGTVYRTDGDACECEAAVHGDPCCQHRAVVRFILGRLTLNEPATETPATIDCGACNGRGWHFVEVDGGHAWPDKEPCSRCGGSGQMPVIIRTIASQSAASAAD